MHNDQDNRFNLRIELAGRVDVVHHGAAGVDELMAELGKIRRDIQTFKDAIMSALSDLQTEVSETSTVVDSAIVLLQGLKAKLDEAIASGDPAALTALSAELDTKTNALAAAVAANTPAEPA